MKFVIYHPLQDEIMIGHCPYGHTWHLLDEGGRNYEYAMATPQTFGWELIGEL